MLTRARGGFRLENINPMKAKNFFLFAILVLLSSCDKAYILEGNVYRASDKKPVAHAKIITAENKTIYTDSLGHFILNRFGPGSKSDKAELLVEKDGYKSEYVDLTGEGVDIHNIRVELTGSNLAKEPICDLNWVERMYLFNRYVISLLALFTLAFLFVRKIESRWIWLLIILFSTVVIRFNCITGALGIDLFTLPFFLKHYGFYPFTIKIAIPFGVIAFWIAYFTGKVKRSGKQ